MSNAEPRWFSETSADHSDAYVTRMRELAQSGADLAGEARLLDALAPRHARILDAGCGPGRVAAALADRGHDVVGLDIDPVLIAAARTDFPAPHWIIANLAEVTMDVITDATGSSRPFDAIVCAGNVMPYLAPGSERTVLTRLRILSAGDTALVVGFGTDRGYSLPQFDGDAADAGWALESRFGTWDLRPWGPSSDWAVSVFRPA